MGQCPFDFLTEHEDWSEWQVDVHWRKMTPEQATQNASLRKDGWKLIGNRYGGWSLPSWRKKYTYYGEITSNE